MVRRLGLGENNHLTYASLALNPRSIWRLWGASNEYPNHMNQCMTKPTIRLVGPAKTQSACTSTQSDQSFLIVASQRGINENPWIYWMNVQADLSLCWSHRSYYRFCLVLVHILWVLIRSASLSPNIDSFLHIKPGSYCRFCCMLAYFLEERQEKY